MSKAKKKGAKGSTGPLGAQGTPGNQKPGKTLRDALKIKPITHLPGLGPEISRELPAVSKLDKVLTAGLSPIHQEIGTNAVDVPLTDEQKCLQAAAEVVRPLMNEAKFRQLVGSMMAFRQCYGVAYRTLQARLAQIPDLNLMAEDLLVQSAMYESTKPFSEHTLMQNIIETVLPWLADTIDTHTAADEVEERKRLQELENDRITRAVPIGFKHTLTEENATLARDRSLVLVGWEPAVLWLLDKVVTEVLTSNEGQVYTIIRLLEAAPKQRETQPRLVRVGPNQWSGCCNTNKSMAVMAGMHVADVITANPDLLICDNMGLAFTKSFTGRPASANAGDAHKQFRKWCDEAGCAFIGGIVTKDKEPLNIRDNEFEQLRIFTDLRAVLVMETASNLAEDSYRIIVGNNASVFDVPKATVDGYTRSSIVLPG